ncbi:hypothetical protein ACC754_45215, partial [Rhizobium johnstonii]
DDETHPYFPELVRLARRFGDAGKSVLGICLGSNTIRLPPSCRVRWTASHRLSRRGLRQHFDLFLLDQADPGTCDG